MEMTLDVIVLAATFLISLGVLIGYTLSERALEARTRRQAAVQRLLNSRWQEIEAARQTIAQQQKASRRSRSDVDAKGVAPYRAATR